MMVFMSIKEFLCIFRQWRYSEILSGRKYHIRALLYVSQSGGFLEINTEGPWDWSQGY